ncbi:hypothetical protein J6590_088051 [Homalodisca vitripennis]|nr:hypothetical protein J6590_088051 [Homalodisca vitripennis]
MIRSAGPEKKATVVRTRQLPRCHSRTNLHMMDDPASVLLMMFAHEVTEVSRARACPRIPDQGSEPRRASLTKINRRRLRDKEGVAVKKASG